MMIPVGMLQWAITCLLYTSKQIYYLSVATKTMDTLKRTDARAALKEVRGRIRRERQLQWGRWAQRAAAIPVSYTHLESGEDIPIDTWTLAYWPDGSVKWGGIAGVIPAGTEKLTLEKAVKKSKAKSKLPDTDKKKSCLLYTSSGTAVYTTTINKVPVADVIKLDLGSVAENASRCE